MRVPWPTLPDRTTPLVSAFTPRALIKFLTASSQHHLAIAVSTSTIGVWIRDGPSGHFWAAAWSYISENRRLRRSIAWLRGSNEELEGLLEDLIGRA